jgi:hypothetical protein
METPKRRVAMVRGLGFVAFAVAATGAPVWAGEGSAPGGKPPLVVKTPVQVDPNLFRPDLAVKLVIAKTSAGGVGTLTMHGSVCNKGTRDYVVPPAAPVDSETMVYTRHPPKTYAQEANLIFPSHQSIGAKVKVGQCVAHDVSVTIPGFVRWVPPVVKVTLAPGERLAEKQLVFRLNRNYPSCGFFAASEDSDSTDNSAVTEVQYVEKAP